VKQAARNQKRIPETAVPDPRTGFPDSYLDDILRHAAVEGPYITALSEQDGDAWETMSTLITCRVHSYLRRYAGSPLSQDILEEDIVQMCCLDFWQWLNCYPYDCNLEAWISQCISNKVLGVCTSAGYRRTSRQVSIDSPLDAEGRSLGDILPDDRAIRQFSQAELRMMLQLALRRLPRLQQEVILSLLKGEEVAECSRRTGRSPNSIYKLRERARKTLRLYMDM
jgi:RNA polymerase sigma factor (sigma-70 family)